MRSMYSKDELLINTAKKKPRLQAYVDNVAVMSDDEIMQLNEPMWIREALKILKQTKGVGQKQRKIEFLAELDEQAKQEQMNQALAKYEIRTWSAPLGFFKGTTLDGRRGWEVEIKDGEPFLVKDSNVILVAGEFYRLSTAEMLRVSDNSKFFMEETMQGYFNYYRDEYLNKKY